MKRQSSLLSGSLSLLLLSLLSGAAAAAEVTCESIDDRHSECALDGRGDVHLVEQLSRSDCREGRDWGAARDRVWVANGCRAVFERDDRYGSGYGSGDQRDGQITCESIDDRRRDCALYGRGHVRLVEKLSRSDCREGYSWGADRDGVWVSNGCRAVFERSRIADAAGEVTCESIDNRHQNCALAGSGKARLTEQLSRTDCREGLNWGSTAQGVWVNGGCRGVFQKEDNAYGYGGQGEEVTCESIDNRRVECPISTRGDVRLLRQLSRSNCVEGSSWGQRRGSVWVSQGCRAVFVSEGRGRDRGARYERRSDRDGDDGLPDEVTCESINDRQSECAVDTRYGIRLLRQLSSTQCIEKRNWGVALNKVWVSGGCRGVFGSTGVRP